MANTKKKTATKKPSRAAIMKQLQDPNLSKAKKNALMEKLYKGIDIR